MNAVVQPLTAEQKEIARLNQRVLDLEAQTSHYRKLLGLVDAPKGFYEAAKLAWNHYHRKRAHPRVDDALRCAVSAALAVKALSVSKRTAIPASNDDSSHG